MPLRDCLTASGLTTAEQKYIVSRSEGHIKNGLPEDKALVEAVRDLQKETLDNIKDIHKQLGLIQEEKEPTVETPDQEDVMNSKGIMKRASSIEDITDPKDLVKQYFVGGGKIHPNTIKEIFGEGSKEGRARIGLLSNSAVKEDPRSGNKTPITVDGLAHQLWETHRGSGDQDLFTTEQFKDAIEQVIQEHVSAGSMAKDLVDTYINKAARKDLPPEVASHVTDKMIEQVNQAIGDMPEEIHNELVNFIQKFQNQYGLIDWDKMQEVTNGFDPEYLELSDNAKKHLDGIVEQNQREQTVGQPVSTEGNSGPQKEGDQQKATEEKLEAPPQTPADGPREPSPPPKQPTVTGATEENHIPAYTGLRRSILNKEHLQPEVEAGIKKDIRGHEDVWNEVINDVVNNNFDPAAFRNTLLNDLHKGTKRTLSDTDAFRLLFDRKNIHNEIAILKKDMEEAIKKGDQDAQNLIALEMERRNNELSANREAIRLAGKESGRGVSALQAVVDIDDLQLQQWTQELKDLYGVQDEADIPKSAMEFIENLHKQYKEQVDALNKHIEELKAKAAEDQFKNEQSKKGKGSSSKSKYAGKVTKSMRDLADKIEKSKFGKPDLPEGTELSGVSLDINKLVADAIRTIADGIDKGAEIADAISSAVKKHLAAGIEPEDFKGKIKEALKEAGVDEADLNAQTTRDRLVDDIISHSREEGITTLAKGGAKPLKALMRHYIETGEANNLSELVTKVHDDLSKSLPDIDERMIRDTYSGYGTKGHKKNELQKKLADMHRQMKFISEYQDAAKKVAEMQRSKNRNPLEEEKLIAHANRLRTQIEGYMHDMGIKIETPQSTPEGQKAMAVERSKQRVRANIEDLNKQIAAGERRKRNGAKVSDEELELLRTEQKKLTAVLDEIDPKEAKQKDAKQKRELSPEEKLQKAEEAFGRQIANYERQIREGSDPLHPERRVSSEKLQALRRRKAQLKKQFDRMQRDITPQRDIIQMGIDRVNESMERKVSDMQAKIDNNEFDSDQDGKFDKDVYSDRRTKELQQKLSQISKTFQARKNAQAFYQQHWINKLLQTGANLKRSFVLSHTTTIAKLGAAVVENVAITPMKEAEGAIFYGANKAIDITLSKIFGEKIRNPLLTQVIEKANRHGIPSWAAEASAWKALGLGGKAWKDFVSEGKNGYSELGLLYGKDTDIEFAMKDAPKEYRDFWYKLNNVLEYPGQVHGAIKSLPKRAEFERSYVLRKEAAKRQGLNVNDPVVHEELARAAYYDAKESILMGDNAFSKAWTSFISKQWEKKNIGSHALAFAMSEAIPIAKVPVNLVLEAGRYTIGGHGAAIRLATGLLADVFSRGLKKVGAEKLGEGVAKVGLEQLTAKQADAILHNLKKGGLSLALNTLAGFFPSAFGASIFYNKTVPQPNDNLEEGDVMVFGFKIPRILADHPLFLSMRVTAHAKALYEYYRNKYDDEKETTSMYYAGVNTTKGLLHETPFFEMGANAVNFLERPDSKEATNFWDNFVTSTVDPGIAQDIAKMQDSENWYDIYIGKKPIRRDVQSTGDAIKVGLPWWRQTLPEK